MEPMFRFTGAADFPDKLKVLLSGSPKSGKTSLLGTVPNIIIADTEPFANNLQSLAHLNLPYKTINSSNDLQQLHMVLADDSLRAAAAGALGMPQIDAVAIDTLDSYQQILKRERLRETRQSQFLRDDWGWLREQMITTVRNFTALPVHVFFVIHTKTKEVGKGDDGRTVVLPALEGSVDEIIAGMVGYSLLCYRKQEIRPDGTPFTKYWLRAEGDETYGFLGNRAAGRLPDVMEPNFRTVYESAMQSRAQIQAPTQEQVSMPASGAQSAPPVAPAAAAPAQVQNVPPPGVQEEAPANVNESAPNVNESAPQVAPQAGPPATDDSEKMNVIALGHVKRIFDAIGLPLPPTAEKMTMGQARNLVMHWKACQLDEADGKTKDAVADMREHLAALGLAPDSNVEYDASWGVNEVIEWVGQDRLRAQEAYDKEVLREAPKSPRSTLINQLTKLGAETKVIGASAPPPVMEAEAVRVLQEAGMNPHPVEPSIPTVPDKCEDCGENIDDKDIAVLAKTRHGRYLCVASYLAANANK